MQKKSRKIFFDLEIIAFELVALNTRLYREREYFSSGVDVLTNSLMISDTIKKIFEAEFR